MQVHQLESQVDEDGRRELPERAMEMLWRPCGLVKSFAPCDVAMPVFPGSVSLFFDIL